MNYFYLWYKLPVISLQSKDGRRRNNCPSERRFVPLMQPGEVVWGQSGASLDMFLRGPHFSLVLAPACCRSEIQVKAHLESLDPSMKERRLSVLSVALETMLSLTSMLNVSSCHPIVLPSLLCVCVCVFFFLMKCRNWKRRVKKVCSFSDEKRRRGILKIYNLFKIC